MIRYLTISTQIQSLLLAGVTAATLCCSTPRQAAAQQEAGETVADGEICMALLNSMPPPAVERAFGIRVLRRDLDVLIDSLSLDEAQQVILESIYLDYESAFAAGVTEARAAIAQLRPVTTNRAAAQKQREKQVARQRMLSELRGELQELEDNLDLREQHLEDRWKQLASIRDALDEREIDPEWICVTTGSGITAAGLALGMY